MVVIVPKILDLTGKIFGKLTVLNRHPENNKWGQTRWDCHCKCGAISTKDSNHLTGGRTTSCGICPTITSDITGNRYGKLTVKSLHSERTADGRIQWCCVCACGGEKITRGDHLKDGLVASCGCNFEYHGMSFSPEYKVWDAMRQRCHNPNNKKYHHYGGRGITVCDEWKESFEAFYRDMGPRPSSWHTLDRRENDKGYTKNNCRWVTQKVQMNNTRSVIAISYQGKTQSLLQWSQELGFNYHNVKYRIHKGMLFEVAIQIDKIVKDSKLTLNGESKTVQCWCKESGVAFVVFRHRISNGWTFGEALTPIEKKLITLDEHSEFLEDWCEILGLEDKDFVYLKILKGDTLDGVLNEIDNLKNSQNDQDVRPEQ